MTDLSKLRKELDRMHEVGKRSVYFVKQRDDGRYFECDIESEATHFIVGHWPSPRIIKELSELPENYIVKSWKKMYEHFEKASEEEDKLYKEFAERERRMRPSWETMQRPFDL